MLDQAAWSVGDDEVGFLVEGDRLEGEQGAIEWQLGLDGPAGSKRWSGCR